MSTPKGIVLLAQDLLKTLIKPGATLLQAIPVHGGDINKAWLLRTNTHNYFLKTNEPEKYPNLFTTEANALIHLRSANALRVPEVISSSDATSPPYLLLPFIEHGKPVHSTFSKAACQLADLHKNTSDYFGYHANNYIGILTQINTPQTHFVSFFVANRLTPLARVAVDKGLAPGSLLRQIDRLGQKLPDIIPEEPPSLLHGDLWNGNVFADKSGSPVFVDPATYFGHRETDIAMTTLFGGFPTRFYEQYNECYPLTPDWQNRLKYFNLYPLLVHLNLFGISYWKPISEILAPF